MSKRTLEADLAPFMNSIGGVIESEEEEEDRDRYVFIAVYGDQSLDNPITRTTLSFSDLALGSQLFKTLLKLRNAGKVDKIEAILHNLVLPFEKRATFNGTNKQVKLHEKTRELIDAICPECVEKGGEHDDVFGKVTNGFYYWLEY